MDDSSLVVTLGCQAIHNAALKGLKGLLKQIISNAPSLQILEEKDRLGRTPLIYAVLGNHPETLSLLLKAGARTDNSDSCGQTALHWAVSKGSTTCVKILLSNGALWNPTDVDGVTPLHLAASHNSTKCLQLLLDEADPQYFDLGDSGKKTPLHWSAAVGNSDHLKLLLSYDANIGFADLEGKIPLHWAASCNGPGAVDCVNTLLTRIEESQSMHGWQDYEGKTSLHWAVIMGNTDVVDALTQSQISMDLHDNMFRTPLHWAALLGLTDKVSLLLDRRADYLARDSNGARPLHYAVYGKNLETVTALLCRSYVEDVADYNDCTAFFWACAIGANDAIQTMIQQRATQYFSRNKAQMTALHVAAYYGQSETVDLLSDLGFEINALSITNMTPVLLACYMGQAKVLKTLLGLGADWHIPDSMQHSALHWACIGGHAYVCQLLLDIGLNIDACDYFGFTPLHHAVMKTHMNCISVLLESGASLNIVDNSGLTALHLACKLGKLESVRLLCEHGVSHCSLSSGKKRLTPLDLALRKNRKEVINYLKQVGALQANEIMQFAAFILQAFFRRLLFRARNLKRIDVNETEKRKLIKPVADVSFNNLSGRSSVLNNVRPKSRIPVPTWMSPKKSGTAFVLQNSKTPFSCCDKCHRAAVRPTFPSLSESSGSNLLRTLVKPSIKPNTLRHLAAITIQRAWKR